MFINPNKSILKALKEYDKNLSLKWNNEYKYWEVWYKRPSGNKLITPVVESIYNVGGSAFRFCPLDMRILDWIISSDTMRHAKKWKWLSRLKYNDRIRRRSEKQRHLYEYIARENYSLLNKELLNPHLLGINKGTDRPDLSGRSKARVGYGTKYHGRGL